MEKHSRYKPVGWRGEPHRHYLAAKGIKTTYNVDKQVMRPFSGSFINKKTEEEQEPFKLVGKVPLEEANWVVGTLDPDYGETRTGFDTKQNAERMKKYVEENGLVRGAWVEGAKEVRL